MSVRTEKVSELIKHQMSAILARHSDIDSLGFITVTDVRVTADLKLAKVFLSIFHPKIDKKTVLERIEGNKRQIRMELGHSVRLKYTPEIQFYLDETLDRVEHLEELFKQIHSTEKKGE